MRSIFNPLIKGILFSAILIFANISFGQISAPTADNVVSTVYTSGAPNDNIYVFCLPNQSSANIATLTGSPAGGGGPWTFTWSQYNTGSFSFTPYTVTNGATSTINNLPTGGYFLSVTDNGGTNVGCYTAWVFNNESNIDVANIAAGCANFQLNGTADPVADFVYYNPPQANSLIIDATTTITVCFDATHTWISDLGFYLVSPCGQTILLSPNPGSNGQGSVCNSGNNINNLCFTTSAAPSFDPCIGSPYSGLYDSYGPAGNVTPIDWTPLYGCDAALGGWTIQIYDCIGGDVGTLDHTSVNFIGAGACGPENITYDSGAISSVINDNSCSPGTASSFTVPPPVALTTPIVIANTITSFQWTSDNPCVTIPNATTSLTPNINPVPDTDTWFYLTATDNLGCTNLVDSAQFINTCPCPITNLTSNILPCNSAPATFDITGQVIFSNPPCTGQLTVTNCSGDQQVFNAPFISPINYNLTFIPADGTTGCTVTANFTNDPATCTGFSTAIYTEPITPDVFDIVDTANCDNFILPAITGTNLTGNESYYTGPNGTGGAILAGTVITTSQTIYIYDQTATIPFCFDEESFIVTINLTPIVTDIADLSICVTYTLPVITGTNLTGGQNFYTGPGRTGTVMSSGTVINSTQLIYIYDETGTIPNCFSEESFIVTINNVPIVTNVLETCNGINTGYFVSFDVNGGTGGPYTVTENLPGGIGGTWTGNTWTSNLIPNTTPYDFDVDDANSCGPINLTGSFSCACVTDAGTMNVTPLSLCENVQANAIHNGDQVFDGNDAMIFVLHDNSGGTLGTILATNGTPDFNFVNPPLSYGTTYYISAVVGDDDMTGGVVLTDPCLSVAIGTPVVWNQLPTADISGTTSICSAANAGLTITLTGTGPFDVVYTDGTSNFNLNGITTPYNFNVNPTVNTNYTLVSVTDLGTICSGTVTGNANITIFTLPIISNIIETCNGTNTAYTVSFDVTGGTGGPFTVTENLPGGIGGAWAGNTWTSNLIPGGTPYDFDVDDVNGCGPVNANGSHLCPCTTDAGTMDPATLNLCETTPANATHNNDETYDADDVIMFILHDNSGGALGIILGTNGTPDFSYNASLTYGVTYYISAVVGNNDGTGSVDFLDPCLSVANGTPVIWYEMPTSDAGLDDAICEGDTYVLSGVATGGTITTWATTGDGSFDNINIVGAEYTPGVNDITNGTVTLTLAVAPPAACPIVFDNMVLTIILLPTAVDYSPAALCEDIVSGGSTSGIDLTSNDNIVNGGTANNVVWYSDINLTTLVGTPNNATAINGQIFYALVTNGNCQDTAEVTYTINSRPTVVNQTPNAGCEDNYGSNSVAGVDLTLLESSINGGSGYTINWYSDAALSASVTAPNSVTVSNGQIYYAEVVGIGNCTSTATVTYNVNPLPTVSFGSDPNPTTLFDPTINFTNTSFGVALIDSNYWSFGTLGFSNDANPSYTFPADTGTYLITLFIQDLNGCVNTTTAFVTVLGEFGIFVPNAFTPDADGINDLFFPNGFGITEKDYNFFIFDRWGEIVFESYKNLEGWDGTYKGKLVPNDVYPWKLFFTDINGETHTKIGHVNLLR